MDRDRAIEIYRSGEDAVIQNLQDLDSGLQLYRKRFRLHEKHFRLLINVGKVFSSPNIEQLITAFYNLCASPLACEAVGWVRVGRAGADSVAKDLEVKVPAEWEGWPEVDLIWKREKGIRSIDVNYFTLSEQHYVFSMPLYVILKSNPAPGTRFPEEYLLFVLRRSGIAYEDEVRDQVVHAVGHHFETIRRITCLEERNMRSTLQSLTKALDARDTYTSGHSGRVADYARAIAKEMWSGFRNRLLAGEQKMTKIEFVNKCYLAALLHDVGKIGMDDFLKRDTGLSNQEWTYMQCHVRESARILSKVDRYRVLGIDKVALHHHEKFNGKGYLKIQGSELCTCTRIIALADSYDAMTSDRSYRQKLPWYIAVDDLRMNSLLAKKGDESYDPVVFRAFERAIVRNRKLFCVNDNDVDAGNRFDEYKRIIDTFLPCESNDSPANDSESGIISSLEGYERALGKERLPDGNRKKLAYFHRDYPGYCKVLLQRRFIEDIMDFAESKNTCFSLALVKWNPEVRKCKDGKSSESSRDGQQTAGKSDDDRENRERAVVERLNALNASIREKGQKNFKISTYGGAFVIYSLSQPDREIYQMLANLEPKFGTAAIVTILDKDDFDKEESKGLRDSGELKRQLMKKVKECHAALALSSDNKGKACVRFLRDIKTYPIAQC